MTESNKQDIRSIAVVGFKVSQETSIYYVKVKDLEKAGQALIVCAHRGADFVSIRFIRGEAEA